MGINLFSLFSLSELFAEVCSFHTITCQHPCCQHPSPVTGITDPSSAEHCELWGEVGHNTQPAALQLWASLLILPLMCDIKMIFLFHL